MPILVLLTICLLYVPIKVLSQYPSPCPETFTYEPRGNEEDRWYGVISLQTRDELTGVWLHVELDTPADLIGNWFGETSSSDNKEYTIVNSKYKLEAGPPVLVRFFVKYNRAGTIPSLKGIRLNGRTICSAQTPENELRTSTPTLHISRPRTTAKRKNTNGRRNDGGNSGPGNSPNRYPDETTEDEITRPTRRSNVNSKYPDETTEYAITRPTRRTYVDSNGSSNERLSTNNQYNRGSNNERVTTNNQYNSGNSDSNSLSVNDENESDGELDFFPGDFANVQRPAQRRGSRPSVISDTSSSCGVVASRPSPLIANGQDTTPGQWPWHVALYHSKGIQLIYTCGATLISSQYVLTAAHCVTKPHTNKPVDASTILAYLGKYDLIKFGPEVQDMDVAEIYVHPDYNASRFYNDIAVMKLSRPAETTNFVRPCCLWEGDTEFENIIGQQGTVVGWGFDQNRKLSNKLMQAQMPVVSTIKCIYSNRDFFSQFTFEKNYCAGFRNGTSVCNGDSGGGMIFPQKRTGGQGTVWQIRGIVSVGVALQGHGICDTSQFIVFTDVAKHLPWIRQILSN